MHFNSSIDISLIHNLSQTFINPVTRGKKTETTIQVNKSVNSFTKNEPKILHYSRLYKNVLKTKKVSAVLIH